MFIAPQESWYVTASPLAVVMANIRIREVYHGKIARQCTGPLIYLVNS